MGPTSNNGRVNRLQTEDRPVHDWYRFVLSFPPHLVREYIHRLRLDRRYRVLDPFCGTGTTLVECKKLGIESIGVEANPMACFASQVKVDWSVDPSGLTRDSQRIAETALAELREQGIEDESLLFMPPPANVPLRVLDGDAARLLLADSISPLPLHKTLVLLDHIRRREGGPYRSHQLLALARALYSYIGNLQFGPEVGVGPAKLDTPVISPWLRGIDQMASDLCAVRSTSRAPAAVYPGDARQLLTLLEPSSIDAVITSPPYPNEKDYTRTTRLESVVLGFISSKSDLRDLKSHLMRSNTRNVYKDDDDDRWIADNSEVQRIAEEIESRRIELGKTSGFERVYSRVAKLYFGGMAKHLHDLRTVLRPGARLAYVVGDQASYLRVMIRTGRILADIAHQLGYEVVGIDLFRTRLATSTGEQLREETVLLRWPGRKV